MVFKNKICLVIGGTRGIGFAVAKKMHQLGAEVAICGRDGKTAKSAALNIDPEFSNVIYFKCDISKAKDVDKMVDEVIKRWGRIDFLINTAGVFGPFGTFESVPFSEHEKTIKTNLLGIMYCCWEVAKLMKKQKMGKIILFSGAGIGGDVIFENASSYYISKGAISFFAEVLGSELAPFNISVNAILPGQILTDLTRATFKMSEKQLGKILYKSMQELKRTGGQSVEPVINLITFLCSTNSKSLTGKLISARWDNLSSLSGSLPSWKYTLRRIEEKSYKKN